MERIETASVALESTCAATHQLADGVQKLTAVLTALREGLERSFADFALLPADFDEDIRAVAELFVAWKDVGEASQVLATKMQTIGGEYRKGAAQAADERKQRIAEAERLQHSLINPQEDKPQRGWFGWLRGKPQEVVEDESVRQAKLEDQRAATKACLDAVAEQMEDARRRNHQNLVDALAEVRRHSKAFGEKLLVLKPSWKGTHGAFRRSATSASVSSSAGDSPQEKITRSTSSPQGTLTRSSSNVQNKVKTITTAEGRQRLREAEAQEEHLIAKPEYSEPEIMTAPPVEHISKAEFRIKGVYEHMVLKAGLRHLHENWSNKYEVKDFDALPKGLFREKLLRDMLAGALKLQSITGNDVSAAQRDLRQLSLPQLLRLRIWHLDFTPSGCGADTITAAGGTHEAFLATLDSLLFERLGRKALEGITVKDSLDVGAPTAHRLGREAVFLSAAHLAMVEHPCWCWWISEDQRVFFNAALFSSTTEFPEKGGVLEITDLSKPDRHEPSGMLRWFDWKVDLVIDACHLSPTRKKADGAADATPSQKESYVADLPDASPSKASPSIKCSGGGASNTGVVASASVLLDARNSLRKVEKK